MLSDYLLAKHEAKQKKVSIGAQIKCEMKRIKKNAMRKNIFNCKRRMCLK